MGDVTLPGVLHNFTVKGRQWSVAFSDRARIPVACSARAHTDSHRMHLSICQSGRTHLCNSFVYTENSGCFLQASGAG